MLIAACGSAVMVRYCQILAPLFGTSTRTAERTSDVITES
jgi:hypothetical protein